MQIPSAPVCARPFTASQKLGESVVRIHEIGEAGTVGVGMTVIRRRKIPIEMLLRSFCTRRVDLSVIKTFALLGIAQQIVGTSDLLELLFGRLVPGIEIRVQFFRELAVCLLDIGG